MNYVIQYYFVCVPYFFYSGRAGRIFTSSTLFLSYLLVAVILMLTLSNYVEAKDKKNNAGNKPENTKNYGKRYRNDILRGVSSSEFFTFNDTKTTDIGPAYANIWTAASNFLTCLPPSGRKISYALEISEYLS